MIKKSDKQKLGLYSPWIGPDFFLPTLYINFLEVISLIENVIFITTYKLKLKAKPSILPIIRRIIWWIIRWKLILPYWIQVSRHSFHSIPILESLSRKKRRKNQPVNYKSFIEINQYFFLFRFWIILFSGTTYTRLVKFMPHLDSEKKKLIAPKLNSLKPKRTKTSKNSRSILNQSLGFKQGSQSALVLGTK